jgi:hypothetical protein
MALIFPTISPLGCHAMSAQMETEENLGYKYTFCSSVCLIE